MNDGTNDVAADTAMTAFLADVAHELRTPLTLMLGPLEHLLRNREMLAPQAVTEITTVQRNAARTLRLVSALVEYSHLENDRAEASYEPTDLAEFTANLASNFRSLIEGIGVRFVVNRKELSEPVYVDHRMWEKVVAHLLSNAVAHTFAGEIGVTVRTRGQRAELVVRDTGTGIPAEHLQKVFDSFYRVPNAKSRTSGGAGMGLALARELVRLHGGDVRIESVVGEGTLLVASVPLGFAHLPASRVVRAAAAHSPTSTMHATSPLMREMLEWLANEPEPALRDALPGLSAAASAPPRRSTPRVSVAAPKDRKERRERILLADDNADMRQFLLGLLEGTYDVETVGDGAAALAAARERVPDLVLSDVTMPGLDGLALLHELRTDPRTQTVPVILVSARSGPESRVEGLDVGADDYLEKPFTTRELVARVNATLRLARMRRAVVEQEQRALVAEAANDAKTRFLTTMSHELRTPLNAIGGYVDLMELGLYGVLTAEQQNALKHIRRSGQRLLGLITNILNYGQLEAGAVRYQTREVAAHDLIGDLEELIEPQARAKNIAYRHVPSEQEKLVVQTDPDRLTQIVLNLLSNAVKFTNPGGRVTVATAVSGGESGGQWDHLRISVTDTGRGIPPDKLALVFEPFVQLDRQQVHESQQGVGLGLAISRDLARQLGGELTAESIVGEGIHLYGRGTSMGANAGAREYFLGYYSIVWMPRVPSALRLLVIALPAAFACTERPGTPPPSITPPHDSTGDTTTKVIPGGATGVLAYSFDTLKSASDSGAPPAWICVPDSGTINDSLALSAKSLTPAGSATLLGLACQASPDSVPAGAINVILISDTTAQTLTASWSLGVYSFQFPYDGATLSLSGKWTDAADTAMTGTSTSLTLPDGHVLSGSWRARKG